MKSFVTGILVLVVAAGGLLATLPFFISSDAVRNRIVEQARVLTGRNMSFRDAPRVLFNPFLGIEINSVIFEDPNPGANERPLVRMEKLRGQLDIVSALFGRVEVERYQFVRPHFYFRVYEDGRVSWGFPKGKVWDVLDQARQARSDGQAEDSSRKAEKVVLGEFEIVDGTIEYFRESDEANETITNVNARLSWPDTTSPLSLTGNCIWRDEAIEYSVRSQAPVPLMSGTSAPLSFNVNSGAFSMEFNGQANTLADLHLSGTTQVTTPSIQRLSKFLGRNLNTGSMLSGVSAQGQLKGTLRQFQITDAQFELDGNRGRGVLQVNRGRDRKLSINGTLAAEQLDLSPYLAALRQYAEVGNGHMPGYEILELLDLDLRVSASQALVLATPVKELAASIIMQNGEAVLNIGNAALHGGTLVGKASLADTEGDSQLRVKGMLSNFDSAAVSRALGMKGISFQGKASADFEFRSQGTDAASLVDNAWGNMKLNLTSGVMEGIDFNAIYAAAGAPDDEDAGLELGGRTAFDTLKGDVGFNGDSAWVRSIRLTGPKLSTHIAGRSAIDFGAIALSVHMQPADTASKTSGKESDATDASRKAGEGAKDVRFFIGGSFEHPLLTRMHVRNGASTGGGKTN